MKRFKSKTGFTLIEMVVTIAILSIVAGMGIGVFATTMKNYSTASVTEQEQQKAGRIEECIVSNAKIATGVKFVSTDSADTGTNILANPNFPVSGTAGYYVGNSSGTNIIESFDYDGTLKTNKTTESGVKQITLTIRRQKTDKDDQTSLKRFFFLDYTIEMNEGYTLKGSTIMNNIPSDSDILSFTTGTFIDNRATFNLIKGSSNAAIVFLKK